jgi:hypothetical protein
MPLYYFDVRQEDTLYEDEEGQQLSNFEAAEIEAVAAAAAIAAEVLPPRKRGAIAVEVRDEQRQPVLVASVELRVARLRT